MKDELVSIIIPAYNAEKYIERCLDSLLAQTYKKIEILVINDGSKDMTGEICDRYASKQENLKVFHVANGGVSNARNIGIREANGTYIMFVDSDDYVTHDFVEKSYEAITTGEADLAITGAFFCYPDHVVENTVEERFAGVFQVEEFGEAFLWLYSHSFVQVIWNKIYKKELIQEEFCRDMSWGEDMFFNLRYMEKIKKISVSEACTYYYMCDEVKDSLTRRVGVDKFQCEEKIFNKTMEICEWLNVKDATSVEQIYAENVIALLFGVAYSGLDKSVKKQVISETCKLKSVKSVMERRKTKYFYSEWIRLLLKNGREKELYYIFMIARFARKCIDAVIPKKRK